VVPLEPVLRLRRPASKMSDNHHRLSPLFSRYRVVY
jgi:hypothetical protein